MSTKEKTYSRKNLLGKIARRIYELNEYSENKYNLIITKRGYSVKWINGIKELTTENLEQTLKELNKIEGGKQ